MTTTDTSSDNQKTFLSKLRQRSAIIFTIGLAISVASFVENLHMGKDAIAYVVAELSKIDGWADAVKAAAAIFHGALEWWRGVLRSFFELVIPFEVPKWLHDPISAVFFFMSRVFMLRHRNMAREVSALSMERGLFGISLLVLLPMSTLYVLDKTAYLGGTLKLTDLLPFTVFLFSLAFAAAFRSGRLSRKPETAT